MTSLTKRSLVLLAAALVFGMLATGAVSECDRDPRLLEEALVRVGSYGAPQWAHGGDSLVFEAGDELYVIDATGENLRRISNRSSSGRDEFDIDLAPNVASNGTLMTYVSLRETTGLFTHSFEVMTADLDGRNARRLTNDESSETNPVWSPDGLHIAFHSDREPDDRGFRLYMISHDGSNIRNIAPEVYTSKAPVVWSPDSKKLAFSGFGGLLTLASGEQGFKSVLYTVNADGSGLANISETVLRSASSKSYSEPGYWNLPEWSPDSTRLAFVKGEDADGGLDSEAGLYVANSDGTDSRRVVESGAARSPRWTTNGYSILYVDGGRLWSVPANGSSIPRDLWGKDVPLGHYLVWSPDGSRLASKSIPGVVETVFEVITLDGSTTGYLLEQSEGYRR